MFTYLDLARCMINSISEGGEIDFSLRGSQGKLFHPSTTIERISSTVSTIWYYMVNISFYIAAVSLVAIFYSVYKAPVKVCKYINNKNESQI